MLNIRWGFLSITGDFRENNEDSCVSDAQGRYFVVADGMGGQSAGERASAIAVEVIPGQLDQLIPFENGGADEVRKGIDKAVGEANAEIMALGELDPNLHSMGTTVVLLVRVEDKFYVGGVGDSRAYQWRDFKLEQLTTDHSLTQALLQHGTITAEEAKTHKYRNVLYRYLGSKEGGAGTDACEIEPRSGDRFLLCSDGVTDGIADEQLAILLGEGDDPNDTVKFIVESAQAGGSRDNITALAVFVD